MSTTIDEKIVSMKFDNSKFEANIKNSIRSISDLKDSLKFDGVKDSFSAIEKAAKNVSFDGLNSGIEGVKSRLASLGEYITAGAWMKIGADIGSFIYRTVDDFTIAPLRTGFQEYEMKMGSVQTIMSSTGADIDTVNRYLEDLNKYSDDTIYSFKDMTASIGKFTNSGVKLEDAVIAMKGISNEAAVSGANAQEASRAMYNLAQSLSMGYVQYIDWKSIENANMATVEFKQNLADTAVQMGIIKKKGDGLYDVYGEEFTLQSLFKDALKEEWLTNDVLISTLKDYADETTEIGKKAYAAAKDVKTFSMMMDTLREASQSGWSQTWEILFGNLEDAKKLWTSISTTLGGIIEAGANKRNSFLKSVLGDDVVTYQEARQMWQSSAIGEYGFAEILLKAADMHGVAMDNVILSHENIIDSLESGWLTYEMFADVVHAADGEVAESTEDMEKRLKDYEKVARDVLKGRYGNGAKRKKMLADAGYDYAEIQNMVNKLYRGEKLSIEDLNEVQTKQIELTGVQREMLARLNEEARINGMTLEEYMETMNGMSRREKLIAGLGNVFRYLSYYMDAFRVAWNEIFDDDVAGTLGNLINQFYVFSKGLSTNRDTWYDLKHTIMGVAAIFHAIGVSIAEIGRVMWELIKMVFPDFARTALSVTGEVGLGVVGICEAYEELIHLIGDAIINSARLVLENEKLKSILSFIVKVIKRLAREFRNLGQALKNSRFGSFTDNVKALIRYGKSGFKAMLGYFKQFLEILLGTEGANQLIHNLREAFTKLENKLKTIRWPKLDDLFNIFDGLEEYLETTNKSSSLIDRLVGTIEYFAKKVKELLGPTLSDLTHGLFDSSTTLSQFLDEVKKKVDTLREYIGYIVGFIKFKYEELKKNLEAMTITDWVMLMDAFTLILFIKKIVDIIRMFNSAGKVLNGLAKSIKTFFTSLSITSAMIGFGTMVAEISAAIFMLTFSLMFIAAVPSDKMGKALSIMGQMIGLVLIVTVILGIVSSLPNFDSKVFLYLGIAFLSISASLLLIVGAIAAFGKVYKSTNFPDLVSSFFSVIFFIGLMAVAMGVTAAMVGQNGTYGAATMILALGASIMLVALAFGKIASIMAEGNPDEIESAFKYLLGLLVVMASVAGLMVLVAGMNGSWKAAVMIVSLAMSLCMVMNALGTMVSVYSMATSYGLISESEFKTMALTVGGLLLVLGVVAAAIIGLSKNAKFGAVLAALGIVAMLTWCVNSIIITLAKIDTTTLDSSAIRDIAVGIAVLFGGITAILLGAAITATALKANQVKAFAEVVTGVVMIVLSFAAIIATLSMLKGVSNATILSTIISMTVLVGVILGMIYLITKSGNGADANGVLSGMAIGLLGLAASLFVLALIPFDKLLIGFGVIAGTMLLMGGILKTLSQSAGNMYKVGYAMKSFALAAIAVGGAFTIIALGISLLQGVNILQAFGSILAVAVAIAALAGVCVLIDRLKIAPAMYEVAGALIMIGVAAALVAGAIYVVVWVLSQLFGFDFGPGMNDMANNMYQAGLNSSDIYGKLGSSLAESLQTGFTNMINSWDIVKQLKELAGTANDYFENNTNKKSAKKEAERQRQAQIEEINKILNTSTGDPFAVWLEETGRLDDIHNNLDYYSDHLDELSSLIIKYRRIYKDSTNQQSADWYASQYGNKYTPQVELSKKINQNNSDFYAAQYGASGKDSRIKQEKENLDEYSKSAEKATDYTILLFGAMEDSQGTREKGFEEFSSMLSGNLDSESIKESMFGSMKDLFGSMDLQGIADEYTNGLGSDGGLGLPVELVPFINQGTLDDTLAPVSDYLNVGFDNDSFAKLSNMFNNNLGIQNEKEDPNAAVVSELEALNATTNEINGNMDQFAITLDGRAIVGTITSALDKSLGSRTRMKARGV